MKTKALISLFICFSIFALTYIFTNNNVYADSLSNNVTEQLENLDLSKLENFVVSLEGGQLVSIRDIVFNMVKGEFNNDYFSFGKYILNLISINIKEILPSFFIIVAISVFCSIIQNAKSTFAQEGVTNVIFFICFLTVILILSPAVIKIFDNIKNTIQNIAKINEIMSPIILTLMIASGGNVSVSIYKPTVQFFSNAVINVMIVGVIPLISLSLIFGIIGQLNSNIKIGKFTDFFNGLIKWIIGITISCYGIFVSVQGISSAIHDGISIKAAKYAISNSIPLIGGFLKDGFDLFVAGSILIKNAVGVASIIALIYYVFSPILYVIVFSLLLKLVAAVTQTISDSKISDLCSLISKSLTYLNVALILTGFMMFISILLMIFSANSFV